MDIKLQAIRWKYNVPPFAKVTDYAKGEDLEECKKIIKELDKD